MIRAGIFFGGASREREVSFSGGRTVFDNLDKSLFAPVPLFIDSFNNIILLNKELVYKGSIRDFYPPAHLIPQGQQGVQVYAESLLPEIESGKITPSELVAGIGTIIPPHELSKHIDLAFLALHGSYGEDGTIQGLLEWLGIPYTGSGIFPSALGMNKSLQKKLLATASGSPAFFSISRQDWDNGDKVAIHRGFLDRVNVPAVLKAANQGSSIGISVVRETTFDAFAESVEKALFRLKVNADTWKGMDQRKANDFVREICDPRSGLGLPLFADGVKIYKPSELMDALNSKLTSQSAVRLEAADGENEVLAEQFIEGREFSCIVIQDSLGKPFALPPTEIIKSKTIFDYRSKYLPGMANKVTPIAIDEESLGKIRAAAERMFSDMNCNVYARIDGFLKADGTIYLNDPNTTSGMMPSSFFFHQASEVGLDPSAFLTYIVTQSLRERKKSGKIFRNCDAMIAFLESKHTNASVNDSKLRVAVIMGGYTAERHISMESGRNIYEKLASSVKYRPIPVFLSGNRAHYDMFILPVNMMLKDNADDIAKFISNYKQNAAIDKIRVQSEKIFNNFGVSVNSNYAPEKIDMGWLAANTDAVFLALHGRPGEDGTLQKEFDRLGIPYNGSGPDSSEITINKFETSNLLKQHGLHAAKNFVVTDNEWNEERDLVIAKIEEMIGYPLIAKPLDEGCSAAVKKIKTREQLEAFAEVMFRRSETLPADAIRKLNTSADEEWPAKPFFLVENFIDKGDAKYFLEVTGGFLTSFNEKGEVVYEMFEPSESVAEQEILSLEEKFLAGQGQNITPARYANDPEESKRISKIVQEELRKAAQLLNVQGYARIDAFVKVRHDDSVEVNFIEVNSLPGMTPATCIFHQCAINGYMPYDFIDRILEFGMQRQKKRIKNEVKKSGL